MPRNLFHSTADNPYHVSAGCVVYNPQTNEMLLASKVHDRDFGFPKGTLEDGETLEACAVRETIEEVGYDSNIVEYLGAVQYDAVFSDHTSHKTVHFFLASVSGVKKDSYETESRWLPLDEAILVLEAQGYPQEKEIAERARRAIDAHS